MHPLLRIWAIVALCAAVLLALRGVWPVAFAVFLLSPAPALLFFRDRLDRKQLTVSWLGVVGVVVAAFVVALVIAAQTGGVPQVHEWRATLGPR